MSMSWHHLLVEGEIGVGEYTYRGERQFHGIVIVQLRDGRISRWREYERESALPFDEFAGPSLF